MNRIAKTAGSPGIEVTEERRTTPLFKDKLQCDNVVTSDHWKATLRAGIRQVRDEFSRYIAEVRKGEQIIISDRGQDIALLRPIRRNDPDAWLKDLVEEGLVEEPESWVPIRSKPSRLRGELLSSLVAQEREQGW